MSKYSIMYYLIKDNVYLGKLYLFIWLPECISLDAYFYHKTKAISFLSDYDMSQVQAWPLRADKCVYLKLKEQKPTCKTAS